MMHPDCRHFMESWDRYRDNRLPPPESEAIARHLRTCEPCRSRFGAVEGISAALRTMDMDPFVKRRIVVAAANFRRPQNAPPWRAVPQKRSLAFGGALAVALAGLAVLLWSVGGSTPTNVATIDVDAPVETAKVPPPAVTELAYFVDGDRRELSLFPGTSLYLSADAVVEPVSLTASFAHFRLTRGHAVAEIGGHEADFRFVITLPHGEVEARGTVFSVRCAEDGTEETRVSEGLVEMRTAASSDSVLVSAGEAVVLKNDALTRRTLTDDEYHADQCLIQGCPDDDSPDEQAAVADMAHNLPTAATRMASALKQGRLDEAAKLVNDVAADKSARISTVHLLAGLARAYRSAKMFNEARDVYLRLINAYPRTSTAEDSLVALGQIEYRTLGLPGEALVHFDRYLDENPTGFLAETARAERIRVLEAGGRYREVIAAADDYIARHGGGFGLSEVKRRRADALVKTGHCREALDEYRRIIQKWPGTMEAKRAEKGLSSCD